MVSIIVLGTICYRIPWTKNMPYTLHKSPILCIGTLCLALSACSDSGGSIEVAENPIESETPPENALPITAITQVPPALAAAMATRTIDSATAQSIGDLGGVDFSIFHDHKVAAASLFEGTRD